MKKIAFFALSAMLLASCSEENAPQEPVTGKTISLSVSGPGELTSRTSTSENNGTLTTAFVAGDKVGVSATGGAVATNVEYKVAADGSKLETATPIAFQYNQAANLTAYTPYSADATAAGLTHTVLADQTVADNFNASNFLTSKATVTKDAPAANLTFTPRTALIYVEMAGELGETANGLTLCAIKPALSWSAASDAVSTSGDAINVNMYKVADSKVFMAFVPAQSTVAAQPLFKIAVGENTYSYTPADAIEFKENTVKRFKLTVNADKTVNVEASVIDGSDWTEDPDKTENIDGEIARDYVEIISAADGNFTDKSLSAVTGYSSAVEGWNALIAGAGNNSTITVSEDEAVIATDGGSWYQRALVFRSPDNKATAHKYALEFDVKGGTDIQIAVMRGQRTGVLSANVHFAVNNATSAKVESTQADYTHKSLTVDFSKISTGDVDFSTGVTVSFYAKDNAQQTHYIKNVTLTEIE